ncbi:MAG: ABC-2 family transporter protein [Dongiaceae bacterium]
MTRRRFDPFRPFRLARALVVHSFSEYAAYRMEMVFWVVGGTLPLFMMFLWIELAGQRATGSFSAADFAAYFLLVFLVRHMTPFVPVPELERAIRHGELSAQLLRPLDPYWPMTAAQLMDIAHRLPITIPVVIVGMIWSGAWQIIAFEDWPLFLLALLGAILLHYNLLYCAGLAAFWMERVRGFEGLMWNGYFVLGGGLAPIALFPDVVQQIVVWSPFRYMMSFPIEIAIGRVAPADTWFGFALLTFWLAFSIGLMRLLWHRGLRRYAAYGS